MTLAIAWLALSGCQVRVQTTGIAAPSAEARRVTLLAISPTSQTLVAGNGFSFSASGGSGAKTFSVVAGGVGGTIDPATGAYVAPSTTGTDTVRVTDSLGASADATVTLLAGVSITPASLKLSLNEQYAFSSGGGLGGYGYAIQSGSGSVNATTGVFTAPPTAGTCTLRVSDSGSNYADASITTTAFALEDEPSTPKPWGGQAWAVAADTLGNVYAVGHAADTKNDDYWTVRKWNGTTWSTIDHYRVSNDSYALAVATDSSNNVYVAGYIYTSGTSRWVVRKWNGSAWTTLEEFQLAAGQSATARAIVVAPSGNIYVAGEATNALGRIFWIVRKWDGATWSTADSFQYGLNRAAIARGIALDPSNPNHVYVVGQARDDSNYIHWTVRKWDGAAWSTMNTYQRVLNQKAVANSVTIDTAGNIYVAGEAYDAIPRSHWIVRKWDGAVWSDIDDYQREVNNHSQAYGIVLAPLGNLYVSGSGYATGAPHSIVRHWDGIAWNVVDDYQPVLDTAALSSGIARDFSGKIHAVGGSVDASGLFHWFSRMWNGSAWSTSDDFDAPYSYGRARAVTTDSSGSVYVAGAGNNQWIVRKRSGATWTTPDTFELAPGKASSAWAALGDGSGNVYVAGSADDALGSDHWIIRKWDGSSWSVLNDYQLAPGADAIAYSLALDASGNLYAAGTASDGITSFWVIRKWDGALWSTLESFELPGGAGAEARGIALGAAGRIYVAGKARDSGYVDHWIVREWNGTAWSTLSDYQYEAGQDAGASGIVNDAFGNLYVSGSGSTLADGTHWIIRKWNGSAWSVVDDYQLAAGKNAIANAIRLDASGNLYVTGSALDSNSHSHWIVRKKNALGWSLTEDFFPGGPTNASAVPYGLEVHPTDGAVFTVGLAQDGQGAESWHVRELP